MSQHAVYWAATMAIAPLALSSKFVHLGLRDTISVQQDIRFQLRAAALSRSISPAVPQAVMAIEPMELSGSPEKHNLEGYMEHVWINNSGIDKAAEFISFLVEDKHVGYIHPGFAKHLRRFPHVFSFSEGLWSSGNSGTAAEPKISLNPCLLGPGDRTHAVAESLEILRSEGLIPGWRNEFVSVAQSFGAPPLLALERAASAFFGIKGYGVHMNGYVSLCGEEHLWVAKRSATKQTFPGRLDHLVAGAQPQGLSCRATLVKECDEEAGIPESIAEKAVSVGAVSYETINGLSYKRDVLFCYDLEMPQNLEPFNKDGEVESFRLLPVAEVARIVRTSNSYKPNCALVLIDFFIRHGHIHPDQPGYLQLFQGLRRGACL